MSGSANHAVVIHGANDVRVEERELPLPGADQVQVAIELGGICGSDISYFKKGAVGNFKVKQPMILGHEIVGTVAEVGAGVSAGKEATRVAVDPSSPCLTCDRCKEGRTNACLAPTFLGSASTDPHVDGGFSSRMVTGVANLVPIPDGVASNDVVFAEPLAVTLHALQRAGGVSGKSVLVIGAGPIGAMAAAAAVHQGADHVAVSDIDPERLAIVTTLGANHTYDVSSVEIDVEFDVVIEASGTEPGINAAMKATRKAGTMVVVGLPHGGAISLPLGLTVTKEMDILGSFRFCHDTFVEAVDALGAGLDLSPLRTDTFHSHDATDAFERASAPGSMKVQLDFREAV